MAARRLGAVAREPSAERLERLSSALRGPASIPPSAPGRHAACLAPRRIHDGRTAMASDVLQDLMRALCSLSIVEPTPRRGVTVAMGEISQLIDLCGGPHESMR